MRFDQMTGIPLYVQVREKLRSEMVEMDPGDPIPVEAELEKKFKVSRITVRRAVEELSMATSIDLPIFQIRGA